METTKLDTDGVFGSELELEPELEPISIRWKKPMATWLASKSKPTSKLGPKLVALSK